MVFYDGGLNWTFRSKWPCKKSCFISSAATEVLSHCIDNPHSRNSLTKISQEICGDINVRKKKRLTNQICYGKYCNCYVTSQAVELALMHKFLMHKLVVWFRFLSNEAAEYTRKQICLPMSFDFEVHVLKRGILIKKITAHIL